MGLVLDNSCDQEQRCFLQGSRGAVALAAAGSAEHFSHALAAVQGVTIEPFSHMQWSCHAKSQGGVADVA